MGWTFDAMNAIFVLSALVAPPVIMVVVIWLAERLGLAWIYRAKTVDHDDRDPPRGDAS